MRVKVIKRRLPYVGDVGHETEMSARHARIFMRLGRVEAVEAPKKEAPKKKRAYKRRDAKPAETVVIQPEPPWDPPEPAVEPDDIGPLYPHERDE